MTSTLISGIGELVTCNGSSPDLLGVQSDAAVVVEGELISWIGPAREAPAADSMIHVGGRAVIPGFVDSHSHLIFAGDRAGEFAARMTGQPYDGGGVGVTVGATRAASPGELGLFVAARVTRVRGLRPPTVGVKSGDGVTGADEAPSLADCPPI